MSRSYPYLEDLVRSATGLDLPLPFPMFGLMVGLAIWAGAAYLRRDLAMRGPEVRLSQGTSGFDASEFAVAVFLAGIVGARIFHILEHWADFLADPLSLLLTRSGFSILGGLIFGGTAGYFYTRKSDQTVARIGDAVAPALMLGYGIGRMGCQISGDGDWGLPADMALKPAALPQWLWAQTYDGNIAGAFIPPPGVYPTPIYESGMALVCCLLLMSLRRHPFREGWLFACYLMLAGIERLLIERIRVNPTFEVAGWVATQAQVISILFVLCGLLGMLILGRRRSTP